MYRKSGEIDSLFRKLFKYLLLISMLLIIFYYSLLLVVNSAYLQDYLAGKLPFKANWSAIRLNLFAGKFSLENLVVDTKNKGELGRIRYLSADLNYHELLSGKILLDSVTIVGLNSDLNLDKISSLIPKETAKPLPKPAVKQAPLDFRIHKIKISSLSASFSESDSMFYQLRTASLTGSFDLIKKKYQLSLFDSHGFVLLPKWSSSVTIPVMESEFIDYNKLIVTPFNLSGFGYRITTGETTMNFGKELELKTELEGRIFLGQTFYQNKSLNVLNSASNIYLNTSGEMGNPLLVLNIRQEKDQFGSIKFDSLYIFSKTQQKQLKLSAGLVEKKMTAGNLKVDLDCRAAFPQGFLNKQKQFDLLAYRVSGNFKHRQLLPGIEYLKINARGKGIQPDSLVADAEINAVINPVTYKNFSVQKRVTVFGDISVKPSGVYNLKADLCDSIIKLNGSYSRKYKKGSLDLISAMIIQDSLFTINNQVVSLDGNASLAFTTNKNPFYDLEFAVNNFQLDRFVKDAELSLNAAGNIHGSKSDDLQGNLHIFAKQGKLWQQAVDSLNISIRAEKNIIKFQELNLALLGGTISGTSEIRDLKNYTAGIQGSGFQLEKIPFLKDKFVNGSLAFDFYGSGLLTNPSAAGTVSVSKPVYKNQALDSIGIGLKFANNQLSVDGNAGFKVSGLLDLVQKEYQVNLLFDNWNYARFIPDTTKELNGSLSGKINATGNWQRLTSLQADFCSIILKKSDRYLLRNQDLSLSYDGLDWRVPPSRFKVLENGFLTARASRTENGKSTIDLNLELPVVEFVDLVPDFSGLSGSLTGLAKISIQNDSLEYQGEMQLNNLGGQLPVTDQLIKNLNGKIAFNRYHVTLYSLQGNLNEGSFNLRGEMQLKKFQPDQFTIDLSATALPVSLPDYFDGSFNGSLNFSGNLEKSKLAGNLDVLDFKYYRDIPVIDNLLAFRGAKTVKPISKPWFGNRVALNITLDSRQPVIVDNNLLYVTVKPVVTVLGTLSNPQFQGRTTIYPGSTVEVINNQFVINKGILDFSPELGYLPDIGIDCQAETMTHKINVSASGNLAEPEIRLTSEPPEEESDLISILLTGRKATELINSDIASTSKEKMAADWLFSKLRKDINAKTGLDFLSLDVDNSFSAKNLSGYGLTVGKKLFDRMMIKYSVNNTSNQFSHQGVLEYQIFENMFFSGYQSTNGIYGGDLKFRNEFR